MVKDIHTKVISIPFNEEQSSILLEKQLNKFFGEEGISLKDIKITHAFEIEFIDFCGVAQGNQIYTLFYEKNKRKYSIKGILQNISSYKPF